jgi:NitT/TauT family transport system ATP-binding protein
MTAVGGAGVAPSVRLSVRNLSHAYEARSGVVLSALDAIGFDVHDGEFVSFVGPSGCGKTTLLRVLNGLVAPQRGEILVDGRPLATQMHRLATVFQSDSLFPWRSVTRNITFGLELRGAGPATMLDAARSLIQLVGLTGFDRSYPHELSGGMRQRVNLARAFAVDPEILLMDEPFGSLDAQTRELMQQELLRIWQSRRKTVVFVTHQIDEAVYLSDRVILMTRRPGRIAEDVAIALPRPRSLAVKRDRRFHEIVDHLAEQLQKEVMAAATG